MDVVNRTCDQGEEFQCSEHHNCIPSSWHCDGENDCSDDSDEVGCGELQLKHHYSV
jgi:hypothetical protein